MAAESRSSMMEFKRSAEREVGQRGINASPKKSEGFMRCIKVYNLAGEPVILRSTDPEWKEIVTQSIPSMATGLVGILEEETMNPENVDSDRASIQNLAADSSAGTGDESSVTKNSLKLAAKHDDYTISENLRRITEVIDCHKLHEFVESRAFVEEPWDQFMKRMTGGSVVWNHSAYPDPPQFDYPRHYYLPELPRYRQDAEERGVPEKWLEIWKERAPGQQPFSKYNSHVFILDETTTLADQVSDMGFGRQEFEHSGVSERVAEDPDSPCIGACHVDASGFLSSKWTDPTGQRRFIRAARYITSESDSREVVLRWGARPWVSTDLQNELSPFLTDQAWEDILKKSESGDVDSYTNILLIDCNVQHLYRAKPRHFVALLKNQIPGKRVLSLPNIFLGGLFADNIETTCAFLQDCPYGTSVKQLGLFDSDFDHENVHIPPVDILTKFLQRHPELEALYLRSRINLLRKSEYSRPFLDTLFAMDSLRVLKCDECLMSPSTFIHLMDHLRNDTHIKTLWLKDCGVHKEKKEKHEDTYPESLQHALKSNSCLTHLHLGCSSLNRTHCEDEIIYLALFKGLNSNTTLRVLQLPRCYMGTRLVGLTIGKMLRSNRSLETLDLRSCGIKNETARHLAEALRVENRTLKELDLAENDMGAVGAFSFRKMLETNTGLERLDLAYNFDPAGGAGVSVSDKWIAALRRNHTLQWLGLDAYSERHAEDAKNTLKKTGSRCVLALQGGDSRWHTEREKKRADVLLFFPKVLFFLRCGMFCLFHLVWLHRVVAHDLARLWKSLTAPVEFLDIVTVGRFPNSQEFGCRFSETAKGQGWFFAFFADQDNRVWLYNLLLAINEALIGACSSKKDVFLQDAIGTIQHVMEQTGISMMMSMRQWPGLWKSGLIRLKSVAHSLAWILPLVSSI